MHITHLTLAEFRNYRHLELELPPRISVFRGDNAQGKTNLLEAIVLLAAAQSPRAGADRELIAWQAEEPRIARLYAGIHRRAGDVTVELSLRESSRRPAQAGSRGAGAPIATRVHKRIRVNGLPRRASDLPGEVCVVMFGPEDIQLVGGPPQLRRRYIDDLGCQLDRPYARVLQRYQRVVSQRNHLLRRIREGSASPQELTFWDEELVNAGSYIVQGRMSAIARLEPLAAEVHAALTGGAEELSLAYQGTIQAGGGGIHEAFGEAIRRRRQREVAAGMTLVGPHRDELRFLAGGIDIGIYGSRAQRRTIVLSLKLAEARLLRQDKDDAPVLLLDDVLSELDAGRRRYLLEEATAYEQVLITATDLGAFDPAFLEQAALFVVSGGQVRPG